MHTNTYSTAITMEETNNQDSTQEQIFENIRIHKEVLQQVKWQPWTMKRKLKLVQQAKSYIAQHEGELQERFASSRSYRDIWQRFKIVIGAVCPPYEPGKSFFFVIQPYITVLCSKMATHETRIGKFSSMAHTMGVTHQRNRIAFRIGSCFLFYIFTMVVLGQYCDRRCANCLSCGTRIINDGHDYNR